MCSREAKFSLSLHCFSTGVYILFQSLNIVFIASLQSPFVLCDSRALPRTCFNTTVLRDPWPKHIYITNTSFLACFSTHALLHSDITLI
jgi:hypothetical protein